MIVKENIIFKRMWCWWCCHSFEGNPLSMPFKYDDRRNKFYTTGNYCSWSCVKSHALERYGCTVGSRINGNVVMMRKKMYNQIGPVKPAPSRYRLIVFGGDLSIEQFRENSTRDTNKPEMKIDTKPYTDNLIPFVSNTKKMDEIKNANSNNSSLKLKRTKPLKRNHNNLESALGLIITPKT